MFHLGYTTSAITERGRGIQIKSCFYYNAWLLLFAVSNSIQNNLLAHRVAKPRVVRGTRHTCDHDPLALIWLLQIARVLCTRCWLKGRAGERVGCSCRVGWILCPLNGLLGSHNVDIIQTSQVVEESERASGHTILLSGSGCHTI